MIFRIHHEIKGGHVHCRLFAGPHDGALGMCGEFVMREREFDHFAWLARSRFEFKPTMKFHEYPSLNANGLANRILDQACLRLMTDEYHKLFQVITTALDDSFELGIAAAGGKVIDHRRPPFPRVDPPKMLRASEVAADWFTLPPKDRTKANLLHMLENDGSVPEGGKR